MGSGAVERGKWNDGRAGGQRLGLDRAVTWKQGLWLISNKSKWIIRHKIFKLQLEADVVLPGECGKGVGVEWKRST